jgi:hypothetical protein
MRGPFSGEDFTSISSILVGIIILVFVAIGLTFLVDRGIGDWFRSSDREMTMGNDTLRQKINAVEMRIDGLKRNQQVVVERQNQTKVRLDIESQLDSARSETQVINQLNANEQKMINLLIKGKETHRLQYRDHVRAMATGETHERIITRLGKEYTKVKILEVTPLGVAVSHQHGAARLGYRDMPHEWKEKYMFTAREVAAATLEERKRLTTARQSMEQRGRIINEKRQNHARKRETASLRVQISSLKNKHSTAQIEASMARSKVAYQDSLRASRSYARSSYSYQRYNRTTGSYCRSSYRPRYRITLYGSKQSVPGSLETWGHRANRYEKLAAAYSVKLAGLRARLSSIDRSYDPSPQRGYGD